MVLYYGGVDEDITGKMDMAIVEPSTRGMVSWGLLYIEIDGAFHAWQVLTNHCYALDEYHDKWCLSRHKEAGPYEYVGCIIIVDRIGCDSSDVRAYDSGHAHGVTLNRGLNSGG